MNFLILNGSPKGKNSVTLHTCLYLEKKFPQHHFEYIQAGHRPRPSRGRNPEGFRTRV